MNLSKVLCLFFSLFTFSGFQSNVLAVNNTLPAPVGDIYVQDFANVLSENEREELRQLGRTIEDQTTAQIAVLTIDSVGNQTINEFANEAFRQYGIGNAAEDNGVLLVMATNERKIWMEVGYGLEGRIPDGKAGRILDEYALPHLHNGQPNIAIAETYKVIAHEVLAEYGMTDSEMNGINEPETKANEGIGIPAWLLIVIVVIVIFLDMKFFGGTLTHLLFFILLRGRGGGGGGGPREGGGGSSGGGGSGRGW